VGTRWRSPRSVLVRPAGAPLAADPARRSTRNACPPPHSRPTWQPPKGLSYYILLLFSSRGPFSLVFREDTVDDAEVMRRQMNMGMAPGGGGFAGVGGWGRRPVLGARVLVHRGLSPGPALPVGTETIPA
jgi:hypothetical protein